MCVCFIIISLIAPERKHSCITDTRVYRVTTARARERERTRIEMWEIRVDSHDEYISGVYTPQVLYWTRFLYIYVYVYVFVCVCIPWHHRAHANNVCTCVSCYYYYIFFISLVFSPRPKVCSRGPEVVEFIIYIYIYDTVVAVQKWRRSSGGRPSSAVTYVHNILWLRIYTGVYVYRRIPPEQISSETRRRDNMRTAPTTVFLLVFEHRLTTV